MIRSFLILSANIHPTSLLNPTNRTCNKQIEGLAYHLPIVGVNSIVQPLKELGGEKSRPAPM